MQRDFLKLDGAATATVYLSISWQPDKGQDFAYQVVKRLDSKGIRAVGDTKGFETMDPKRVRRIMGKSGGFLSVLPYRPDSAAMTSEFMVTELELAIKEKLTVAVLYDSRISLHTSTHNETVTVTIGNHHKLNVPKERWFEPHPYHVGVEKAEEQALLDLSDFIEFLTSPPVPLEPYAFFITRLQDDFDEVRRACIAAVEEATGVRCLWIDDESYSSTIEDTIERAKLLIQNAEFVVAEISLTEEQSRLENPSRAHEVGLAVAFKRPVYVVSREPRRHPYHGLVSRQVIWWRSEPELKKNLAKALYSERDLIGRHVYNNQLPEINPDLRPRISPRRYEPDPQKSWIPPGANEISPEQRWIYAGSFALIAACLASLLRRYAGYEDTLDFVAILAGVITLFFSSSISESFNRTLARVKFLRWLVPLAAILLTIATVIDVRSEPPATEKNGDSNVEITPQAVEDSSRNQLALNLKNICAPIR